jgi:predicted phage gp36 major capsid-like protein
VPIHLKVETELDQSSARNAANEIQDHFRTASRDIGTDFSKGLKSGIGQRGALLWFRTGSDVVIPNAFRLLSIPTTA